MLQSCLEGPCNSGASGRLQDSKSCSLSSRAPARDKSLENNGTESPAVRPRGHRPQGWQTLRKCSTSPSPTAWPRGHLHRGRLGKAPGQQGMSLLCGGSSQHCSFPSCPDTCIEHCGAAVSPSAHISRRVTKGHHATLSPLPSHGDHGALCHREPQDTPPPHPNCPSLHGRPCPKC